MFLNLLIVTFLLTCQAYATNLGGDSEGTLVSLQSVEVSGNIGIGSTNPGENLDVGGTARVTGTGTITLYSDNGGTTTKFNITRSGYGQENGVFTGGAFNGLATGSAFIASINATQLSLGAGSNPITFDTDSWTERMRIMNSSGNVGINSTNPGQLLDVQGTIRSTAFTTFPNGSLTGNTNYIAANLGIGSTNPEKALDVQGTVRMTGFNLSTSPANNDCLVSDAGGNGAWQACPGGSSSPWTVINSNDVYLPNNGNVGIGTNKTTTAALTVMNGNVGIGTWVPATPFQVNGYAYINYAGGDSPGPGAAAFYVNTASSSINGGTAMRITLPTTGSQKALQFANDSDSVSWGSFEYNVGGSGLPGFALGPGGNTSRDTTVYRNAAGVLRTNSALIVDGNVGIGTTLASAQLVIPALKATTGTRYLCIDTSGKVTSSATACSGT